MHVMHLIAKLISSSWKLTMASNALRMFDALSVGTNLIHGKNARFHDLEFLKCAKFHGKFM